MVYIWAALIAYIAASAELVTRYKDDPLLAMFSRPSLLYTGINAALAAGAVALLLHYYPNAFPDGVAPTDAKDVRDSYDTTKVALVCGLGSLTILRASLFKVRVNESDISIGPAVVVDQVLKVVDRAIDRKLAAKRLVICQDLMPKFDFVAQGTSLTSMSLALLQNHTAEEKKKVEDLYESLKAKSSIDADTKAMLLVLALLDNLGEKALRGVVAGIPKLPAPSQSAPST